VRSRSFVAGTRRASLAQSSRQYRRPSASSSTGRCTSVAMCETKRQHSLAISHAGSRWSQETLCSSTATYRIAADPT